VARSTTTTTTTTPPTTTPPTASIAGAVVSALDAGVTKGSVAPKAARQLTNQLQPLLVAPTAAPAKSANQMVQQFDRLVQDFNQDVANGQIIGASIVATLAIRSTALPRPSGRAFPP